MIQIIIREARTDAEYARRVEALNSTEKHPLSDAALAAAYAKAPKTRRHIVKLIQDARSERTKNDRARWKQIIKEAK